MQNNNYKAVNSLDKQSLRGKKKKIKRNIIIQWLSLAFQMMHFLPRFLLTQSYLSLKGDKSLPVSKSALLSDFFSEQYSGYQTIQ